MERTKPWVSASASALDQHQRADRQIGDGDRGDDAADQRADDAVVAPLARPAVARAQDDGDGQQHPIAVAGAAAEGLRDQGAGDHRRGQPHGVAQHRRAGPKLLGELARIVGAARREGGEVDFADRRRRGVVVGDRAFEPLDVAARVEQARDRRLDRRALLRIELVAHGEPRRLAPHRVGRDRMAGRQPRLGAGQQIEAEVLQVERGGAQGDADARRQRPRRRPVAQGGQVALRRDQRVERVEQHADRRGEPHALGRRARPIEQQRARRLQLLGERRLLADRRAVDFGEVDVGVGEARDGAQIGGKFAERLARHHPPVVAAISRVATIATTM